MRTALAFVLGTLTASLIAATAFRGGGGMPVDSTFTYQGQLRNAGQLVNGNVDVRFTLWDSDIGGTQIGNTNSFPNYPLTDGRFALGLNFGTGAFNGDQRWVQVEFRSPAGFGQYLTLSPRDKIQATPYALYALNGVESQWHYNPKTQALSTGENVAKVGIGTSTPTALLEVVGEGGDDAVKLPAGSIGASELTPLLIAAASFRPALSPESPSAIRRFTTEADGYLMIAGVVRGGSNCCSGSLRHEILVNGVVVRTQFTYKDGSPVWPEWSVHQFVPLTAGSHEIELRLTGSFTPYPFWVADDELYLQFVPSLLFAE